MTRIPILLTALAAVSLTACQPFTPASLKQDPLAQGQSQKAPVKISLGAFSPRITTSGFGVQTVPTYEITQARIEVRGPGMAPDSATVTITAGKGAHVFDVPMGPNRIFTAFALRQDATEVPGAVIRAVKTIEAGENEVNLEWSTTPTGEAFTNLLDNSVSLASNTDAAKVQQLVNSVLLLGTGTITTPLVMHPSMVDGLQIARDIRLAGGTIPTFSPSYVKAWGKVSLTVNGLPAGYTYDAWIDDPASPLFSGVAAGPAQTIGPVLAGTWNLHIVTRNAAKQAESRIQEAITLVNGQTRTIKVDLAGPTTANIDFASHDGILPPDLDNSVPVLVPGTAYQATGISP